MLTALQRAESFQDLGEGWETGSKKKDLKRRVAKSSEIRDTPGGLGVLW